MRVVFFGTPTFAANVLEYLLQEKISVVAVISKPDRAKGRSGTPTPTPVKSLAEAYSIPVHQPEIVSSPEFAETLFSYQADLFVVVAYGEIIKQHLLDMPRLACINLHASLLPKYRGAAPIQRAIMNGEHETGVTIMHMVRKMDAGNMIKKISVPIEPETTYGELESLLCEVGKKELLNVIHSFEDAYQQGEEQDLSEVTMAPKIELEDCEIDWSKSSQSIHDLVRGVNPFPGAWCYVKIREEKKRLKVNLTHIVNLETPEKPGTILNIDLKKGNLLIATADDAIELCDVQLEGKKRMSSGDLCNGIPRDSLTF